MGTLAIQRNRGIAVVTQHSVPIWETFCSEPRIKARPGTALPSLCRASTINMVDHQELLGGLATAGTGQVIPSVSVECVKTSLAAPRLRLSARLLRIASIPLSRVGPMLLSVLRPPTRCGVSLAGSATGLQAIAAGLVGCKVLGRRWELAAAAITRLHPYHASAAVGHWYEVGRSAN